jgi:hypothetical protein
MIRTHAKHSDSSFEESVPEHHNSCYRGRSPECIDRPRFIGLGMHYTHVWCVGHERMRDETEVSMLCNGYDKVLELADGDLVELHDGDGTTLRVTKGALWITQEHDTRDIVLRAGDVWTVERQGLTLLQAQEATVMCAVGGDALFARSGARSIGVGDQLRNWFQSASAQLVNRKVPYY